MSLKQPSSSFRTHAILTHSNCCTQIFNLTPAAENDSTFWLQVYARKTQSNSDSYQLRTLLLSKRKRVVCLVPRTEWRAVNADDTVLHQRLGAYKLIITSVVQHVNDASLPCYG